MRYFISILVLTVVTVVAILGFRGSHSRKTSLYIFPDMEWQLKLRPQKDNGFFPNGLSSQMSPQGTVARAKPIHALAGEALPFEDAPVFTGRAPGTTNFVELNPMPITATYLQRGQQRFTIYCSPCHGAQADGNGITKKIGAMAVVANLHDKRIVGLPDGEIFHVITNGRNLMGSYASQVTVQDRWAIIAYVRALQFSHLGTVEDLPQPLRAALKK
ncbi:MAG: cytochrome c [Verrucomicrobiota bacterium]|jgi:mono/diheme cytochrome c family protein|nr:cytochrome c [Verrucomicrobiota bacterium]